MSKMNKSEEEWKRDLSNESFHILRKKGTEPAFTGKYYNNKEKGDYFCAGCGEKLFGSDKKFDSGSGWPSFYASEGENSVEEELDKSSGMIRTEVKCANCGGHLGHLFPDGPQPTGMP